MRRTFLALASLVVVALAAGPASAHEQTKTKAKAMEPAKPMKPMAMKKSALSQADRDFLQKAGAAHQAEIALGRLASERGKSEVVKQYGQRMVTDHTRSLDELAAIAAKDGVMLPTQPSAAQKRVRDRLARLPPAKFDAAYMKQMEKSHADAKKLFKKESTAGKSPALREYARKTLPTIEHHAKMASSGLRRVM